MKLNIYLDKSVEENASIYFDAAKKAKKKLEGARIALKHSHIKLEKIEKEHLIQKEKLEIKPKTKRKAHWYEKFRWFYTSEGFLVIAGRDATTNEIIIKKHTDKEDIVFHSELPSSPFGVIKTDGQKPDKLSLEETAQFIGVYSKAWKSGRTVADVFYVNPDQVTKEAPSGEFIGKGSFMIYGKKNIVPVPLKLYIGLKEDGSVMSGPETAVKKSCSKWAEIVQGNEKTSSIAKKVQKILGNDDLDDIVKVIPVGSEFKQLK